MPHADRRSRADSGRAPKTICGRPCEFTSCSRSSLRGGPADSKHGHRRRRNCARRCRECGSRAREGASDDQHRDAGSGGHVRTRPRPVLGAADTTGAGAARQGIPEPTCRYCITSCWTTPRTWPSRWRQRCARRVALRAASGLSVHPQGYRLMAKSDQRFIELVWRILLREFDVRPPLSVHQFFAPGFAVRKIQVVHRLVDRCRRLHVAMEKAARPRGSSERGRRGYVGAGYVWAGALTPSAASGAAAQSRLPGEGTAASYIPRCVTLWPLRTHLLSASRRPLAAEVAVPHPAAAAGAATAVSAVAAGADESRGMVTRAEATASIRPSTAPTPAPAPAAAPAAPTDALGTEHDPQPRPRPAPPPPASAAAALPTSPLHGGGGTVGDLVRHVADLHQVSFVEQPPAAVRRDHTAVAGRAFAAVPLRCGGCQPLCAHDRARGACDGA